MQSSSYALPLLAKHPVFGVEPGTVAMCFVIEALDPLNKRGMDVEAILQQVGISHLQLELPHARVTAKQYGSLWRLVSLLIDDELFNQDSRGMKPGSFAMICHSVLNCKSLQQAVDRTLRFFNLMLNDISGAMKVDQLEASLELAELTEHTHVFAQECLLMLIHGLSCWLIGRRIPITRADFGYPEPPHSSEYRLMYTSDLTFNASRTRIFFESKYLSAKIVQNQDTIKDFLRSAPDGILVRYRNATSISVRVRRRLRRHLADHAAAFESLAVAMGMAPATLRRRLFDEGTSYQAIKNKLRCDLAVDHLTHSTRSIADIGIDLGFSEHSAFNRAFKKWLGVAPSEFRLKMRRESQHGRKDSPIPGVGNMETDG